MWPRLVRKILEVVVQVDSQENNRLSRVTIVILLTYYKLASK